MKMQKCKKKKKKRKKSKNKENKEKKEFALSQKGSSTAAMTKKFHHA